MEEQNHIDKALAFLESLEKLGNQLKVAEENQKQFLARMLELKKSGETDSEEYADLSRKSKGLQDIIDKWRPIYLERMEMVKSVQMKKRKRTERSNYNSAIRLGQRNCKQGIKKLYIMNARTLYIYISNNLQIALSIENNKKIK